MNKIGEHIRQRAAELLESREIDAFIGFRQGSLPMTTQHYVARSAAEAQNLVWNSFCVLNPTNILPSLLKSFEPPRRPGDPLPDDLPKVGIAVTGCWSRNLAIQFQENQASRKRVIAIGLPCTGMSDRRQILAQTGEMVTEVSETAEDLYFTGGTVASLKRTEILRPNCASCVHPQPVARIMTEVIEGDCINNDAAGRFAEVEEIEAKDSDGRWDWFSSEFSACIRCYSCRNACPLCYCPTCFVDDAKPQWVGKGLNSSDTSIFHILRAYHCAGRCTDCGSCEAACPMGLRLRLLTKKLDKDVVDMFDSEAGVEPFKPLPLSTYSQADPQPFIVQPSHSKGEDS